jgi:hypothetical protein
MSLNHCLAASCMESGEGCCAQGGNNWCARCSEEDNEEVMKKSVGREVLWSQALSARLLNWRRGGEVDFK